MGVAGLLVRENCPRRPGSPKVRCIGCIVLTPACGMVLRALPSSTSTPLLLSDLTKAPLCDFLLRWPAKPETMDLPAWERSTSG